MRKGRWTVGSLVLAVGLTGGAVGATPEPQELAPVLHSETEAGVWHLEETAGQTPTTKTVDGDPSDWIGSASRFSGTTAFSAGEAIYTDHLFDAYGGDDGRDQERDALLGPARAALPQSYRIEPLLQADVPGEVGAPNPYPAEEQYGDAGYQAKADLVELRIAADDDNIYVLARMNAMTSATDAALLVLANTGERIPFNGAVPFDARVTSRRADTALFLAHGVGQAIASDGTTTDIEVVADASGWNNAIEASIPRALIEGRHGLRITVASGLVDPARPRAFKPLPVGASLANIAFREREPVRIWFDYEQATVLSAVGAASDGIDRFEMHLPLGHLTEGVDRAVVPDRGYFERTFMSNPAMSVEGGTEFVFQQYGVYLPPNYAAATLPLPLTWWFHWRGGKAHSAATVVPRFMRDMGDGLGGIGVSPRGRGTSTWYLGKGMVELEEVWADLFATFSEQIDRDRVYVSGHSMGGWASYLMPILYPDRFAASFPVSPPVTQGAWTGLDFAGCDNYTYGEYSFCYVKANDSNPRVQHTRKMLENLRNVPMAIYAGGIDELVPISGVIRQAERLVELGYRHRLYIFPTYEHYSPPIVDEWMEGARYFQAHRRDMRPARVTYVRDMPFERSVERGPSQVGNPFTGANFSFDHAYWMRDLTPADMVNGRASIDARTYAKRDPSALALPEAGGPAGLGQTGPFEMTGLSWFNDGSTPALSNGFSATMTGVSSVLLDTNMMGLDVDAPVTADLTSDRATTLRLNGTWTTVPRVAIQGQALTAALVDGVLVFTIPAGTSQVIIG